MSLNILSAEAPTTLHKVNINWRDPKNLAIVAEELKKSPDNMKVAFEIVALRVGSKQVNVSKAWYKVIKPLLASQFTIKSNQKVLHNTKNTPRLVTAVVQPIHSISTTAEYDGMRIVTIKQYYTV